MTATLPTAVGTMLLYHGTPVVIRGSDANGVVLQNSSGAVETVDLRQLARDARRLEEDGDVAPGAAFRLATATNPPGAPRSEHRASAVQAYLELLESGLSPIDAASSVGVPPRTMRRWLARVRTGGATALADLRTLSQSVPSVDPRWDEACVAVLSELVTGSTLTRNVVLRRIEARLVEAHGAGVVPAPSRSTAYRRLETLSRGKASFGSAPARRSIAKGPQGVMGRLVSTRPGEYLVLDTKVLDVFAMEPTTCRWTKVELTIALDKYSKTVHGLHLAAVSTRATDVGRVLYECIHPASDDTPADLPFLGVPANLLLGCEEPDGVHQRRHNGLPALVPESILIDRGKPFLSAQTLSACARLGISVQPARPRTPTDKPDIERFFRTMDTSLFQNLPGYTGGNVLDRGERVEEQTFYFIDELEEIIREWISSCYHRTAHAGLVIPERPGFTLSPQEMLEYGLSRAGGVTIPAAPELAYLFLQVQPRTIQRYGVEVEGRRYDGEALNSYRQARSPYPHLGGKWPIYQDPTDVRWAYFRDPATEAWHRLEWEHAKALNQPFGRDAAEYLKRLAVRENRFVDPEQAVTDLLERWSRKETLGRRDRNTAQRISLERARQSRKTLEGPEPPVLPPIPLSREPRTRTIAPTTSVFEDFFDTFPDLEVLEVYEE